MDNPETLAGKIDAAWNYVEQIGLALNIGDVTHAKKAKVEAARLLSLAMDEADEYDGLGLIRAERQRQLTEERWTAEHDDGHTESEMVVASNQYSSLAAVQIRGRGEVKAPPCFIPKNWPWEPEWWKPSDDPKRNLVKAGALIAAELDRLNRLDFQAADDAQGGEQ